MEKVNLTVSIEELRLDVLGYCLKEKNGSTVQEELEKRLDTLYEEYVSEDMRGYVDSKIKQTLPVKTKGKRAAPIRDPKTERKKQPQEIVEEAHHEQ